MNSCIKITPNRGSGTCIKIHAFRAEGCITVTANKEDGEEIPPLPQPTIEWSFECFDLIAHGLNNFIAIGKYIKISDGNPVSSENILARFTAIVGLGIEPVPVYNFDSYQIVSDLTEECYLNAFNTNSGLDNVAIVYAGGTKARYFDWTLSEISLITDRHGYGYDAFHLTDDTCLGAFSKTTKTYYKETLNDSVSKSYHLDDPYGDGCQDAYDAIKRLLDGFNPQNDTQHWSVVVPSENKEISESGYCVNGATTVTVYEGTTILPATKSANTDSNFYEVCNISDTSTFITPIVNLDNAYIKTYHSSFENLEDKEWTTLERANVPIGLNYVKTAQRNGFHYSDNILTDDVYLGDEVLMSADSIKYWDNYLGDYVKRYRVRDTDWIFIEAGFLYNPSKYIQLNGGDPHKIQTGQEWTAIGSACISTDRGFVCEDLPTTPSGKTGSVVGDRCVIPTENAEGIKALFSLDQSFIIDEHKIPAQIVL